MLANKTGLIVGVANKRSIAWAIAQAATAAGARLALTYQGERLEENVRELCGGLSDPLVLPLDVTDDGQIVRVFEEIDRSFGGLDFLVHGAAFAPRDELTNPFVQTSREGFKTALDVSAYSLIALSRGALPLMERRGGGSILTLTYLGSERVFVNYNVMGVAKAALEATVRYLAAHLRRSDQDAGGVGRLGLLEHPPGVPRSRAAQAHRRYVGGRRRGDVPADRR